MAEQREPIVLNEGADVGVGLIAGAQEHLDQLLGEAPGKRGVASLKVVKNAADVPFVAVFVAGKHVGYLSHADAQRYIPVLEVLGQEGRPVGAKATVVASSEGAPVVRLSLAAPDRLIDVSQAAVAVSQAPGGMGERHQAQSPPIPCPACGSALPSGARFCPECRFAVAALHAGGPLASGPGPFSGVPHQEKRGWWARRSKREIVLMALFAFIVLVAIPVTFVAVPTYLGKAARANDEAAKSLVRNAATAMENGYIDTGTFAVQPEFLRDIDPSVDFRWAPSHVVTLNGVPAKTTASAKASAVDYHGGDLCYSVSTVSATGTLWGVYVDKRPLGGTILVRSREGVVRPGW